MQEYNVSMDIHGLCPRTPWGEMAGKVTQESMDMTIHVPHEGRYIGSTDILGLSAHPMRRWPENSSCTSNGQKVRCTTSL